MNSFKCTHTNHHFPKTSFQWKADGVNSNQLGAMKEWESEQHLDAKTTQAGRRKYKNNENTYDWMCEK